jgi:oxygen-independent coproporphyrinogen-3 oxidase
LLDVLDRVAQPDTVRRAFYDLRDAGFDNISFDLIYGIPGQTASDLAADLGDAVELGPEHLSCYELEAKPGTRFTHAHGAELARQAEAMESYFELVVESLSGAGYRWYETANFCRAPEAAGGRDLRARHNLAYWLGRDYLGVGLGAVSTIQGRRWRNTPRLAKYVDELGSGARPAREVEPLSVDVRRRERLMLGLRLDEPLGVEELSSVVDEEAVARLQRLGLVRRELDGAGTPTLALTQRGRFLGGGVTADLLA